MRSLAIISLVTLFTSDPTEAMSIFDNTCRDRESDTEAHYAISYGGRFVLFDRTVNVNARNSNTSAVIRDCRSAREIVIEDSVVNGDYRNPNAVFERAYLAVDEYSMKDILALLRQDGQRASMSWHKSPECACDAAMISAGATGK